MNWGQSFREIRESKNMSLAEVSNTNFSVAQLSKFERGDSDITVSKLFSALEHMNVSMEEYIIICQNYEITGFEKLLKKLNEFHTSNNINLLNNLLEEHTEDTLNRIMILSVMHDVEPKYNLNEEEKGYLTDYLMKVSEWGYYEIVLFANSVSIFNVGTLVILAREMLHRIEYYKDISSHKRLIVQTLINVSIICIQDNQLKKANFFLKNINYLLSDETLLYEKNVYHFTTGYYSYKCGDKKKGLTFMNDSINTFKILGSQNLAANYNNFLNEFIVYDKK